MLFHRYLQLRIKYCGFNHLHLINSAQLIRHYLYNEIKLIKS